MDNTSANPTQNVGNSGCLFWSKSNNPNEPLPKELNPLIFEKLSFDDLLTVKNTSAYCYLMAMSEIFSRTDPSFLPQQMTLVCAGALERINIFIERLGEMAPYQWTHYQNQLTKLMLKQDQPIYDAFLRATGIHILQGLDQASLIKQFVQPLISYIRTHRLRSVVDQSFILLDRLLPCLDEAPADLIEVYVSYLVRPGVGSLNTQKFSKLQSILPGLSRLPTINETETVKFLMDHFFENPSDSKLVMRFMLMTLKRDENDYQVEIKAKIKETLRGKALFINPSVHSVIHAWQDDEILKKEHYLAISDALIDAPDTNWQLELANDLRSRLGRGRDDKVIEFVLALYSNTVEPCQNAIIFLRSLTSHAAQLESYLAIFDFWLKRQRSNIFLKNDMIAFLKEYIDDFGGVCEAFLNPVLLNTISALIKQDEIPEILYQYFKKHIWLNASVLNKVKVEGVVALSELMAHMSRMPSLSFQNINLFEHCLGMLRDWNLCDHGSINYYIVIVYLLLKEKYQVEFPDEFLKTFTQSDSVIKSILRINFHNDHADLKPFAHSYLINALASRAEQEDSFGQFLLSLLHYMSPQDFLNEWCNLLSADDRVLLPAIQATYEKYSALSFALFNVYFKKIKGNITSDMMTQYLVCADLSVQIQAFEKMVLTKKQFDFDDAYLKTRFNELLASQVSSGYFVKLRFYEMSENIFKHIDSGFFRLAIIDALLKSAEKDPDKTIQMHALKFLSTVLPHVKAEDRLEKFKTLVKNIDFSAIEFSTLQLMSEVLTPFVLNCIAEFLPELLQKIIDFYNRINAHFQDRFRMGYVKCLLKITNHSPALCAEVSTPVVNCINISWRHPKEFASMLSAVQDEVAVMNITDNHDPLITALLPSCHNSEIVKVLLQMYRNTKDASVQATIAEGIQSSDTPMALVFKEIVASQQMVLKAKDSEQPKDQPQVNGACRMTRGA